MVLICASDPPHRRVFRLMHRQPTPGKGSVNPSWWALALRWVEDGSSHHPAKVDQK
jgi:hypothetical protein